MGAVAKVDVGDGEAGEFGDPQPGLGGHQEERVVAAAVPGREVGRGQEGFDLGPGQEADGGVIVSFGWDGEHPGDQRGVLGDLERGVAEQRADGRQPGVAGSDAVASRGFQVLEEPADQRGVQVGEVQPAGELAGALAGIAE